MSVLIVAMKFRNFCFVFIANLPCFVVFGAKIKEFSKPNATERNDFENYQYLNEKKVQFTKATAQYVKFGVNLPSLLDFAMCLWYKPNMILDHNILFSYGNQKDDLILWKIKKKQNVSLLELKILDSLISEEPLPGLQPGQWHHICQYWQGSTGQWALFFNTYIVSFGYSNASNTSWHIPRGNFSATINRANGPDTLEGEIYGFHLTSLDIPDTLVNSRNASTITKTMTKRQTDSIPVDAEPRALFFVGKLFTFVRRMVSFVATPIFRFMRGLISPWRKSFTRSKPTEKPPIELAPSTATEIINLHTTTSKNILKLYTSTVSKANETIRLNKTSYVSGNPPVRNDLTNLEESLTIYETESDGESRYSRNINHTTHPKFILRSMHSLAIQPKESDKFHAYNVVDKCLMLELTFKKRMEQERITDDKYDPNITIDPITRLGTRLQFMQFLYTCCIFETPQVLISWRRSRISVNNAVIESISGCGNF